MSLLNGIDPFLICVPLIKLSRPETQTAPEPWCLLHRDLPPRGPAAAGTVTERTVLADGEG